MENYNDKVVEVEGAKGEKVVGRTKMKGRKLKTVKQNPNKMKSKNECINKSLSYSN